MAGIPWSKKEDQIVAEMKKRKSSDKEIALALGRSAMAVGCRVSLLGLRSRPERIPADVASDPLTLRGYLWSNRILPKLHQTPSGCLEWREKQIANGYGRITITNGSQLSTHRVSLEVSIGRLLIQNERSLHKCDNPSCCNPEHLFVGSDQDNVLDKWQKGRANHAVGEAYSHTKLSASEVIQIRSEYASRTTSYGKLAKKYKVKPSAIVKIVKNVTWKHLNKEVGL